MIRIGLYLGIGAICHLIFIGAQFDWSSAWTWVWLLGWPLMVLFAICVVFAAFTLLIVLAEALGTTR